MGFINNFFHISIMKEKPMLMQPSVEKKLSVFSKSYPLINGPMYNEFINDKNYLQLFIMGMIKTHNGIQCLCHRAWDSFH